jgi:ribonuclease-3
MDNNILNEKNILISEEQILKILNKYGINNFKITNYKYFIQAFVHKSYCNIELFDECYERLEFLGDKIVKLTIATYLFYRYPELDEGFLSRLQFKLEDKNTLAYISKELQLNKYFIISKYIELNNGRNLNKINEDIFESFIAALYLNSNYNVCLYFITNILETMIDYSDKLYCDNNYKDYLLRIFHQKKLNKYPIYKVLKIEEYINKKIYLIGIENIDNSTYLSYGLGPSKKEAEQKAAKMALIILGYLNKEQYNENDIYYPDFINNENNECINKYFILNDNELIENKNNIIKEENNILEYNENNILITEQDVRNIFKNYDITLDKINNFEYIIQAFVHKSYCKKNNIIEKNNVQKPEIFDAKKPEIFDAKKPEIFNAKKPEIFDAKIPEIFDVQIPEFFDKSYEKIKYIGDKVIKLSIDTYLFFRYPHLDEGFMTSLAIKLEDKNNFILISKELKLEKFFIISKKFELIHGRNYDKLHEEIFKSFIGSIYLTCGFEKCLLLITEFLETLIDYTDKLYYNINYKDLLLRIFHKKKYNETPIYELLYSYGPSHKMQYIIGIKNPELKKEYLGFGIGNTKTIAEQKAAKMALILLNYLNKDQYNDNDLYYYPFYREKLESYMKKKVEFTEIEKNDKYIVKIEYENIISYGCHETLYNAEEKAIKMALILLNIITDYTSDDIFYYQEKNEIIYSDKSI